MESTKETSTGMSDSFSSKSTFSIISLGSRHRTRKNPFKVILKSRSLTLGMSLISIPGRCQEKWLHCDDCSNCLVFTNIDVSLSFIWKRVLAVAVRYWYWNSSVAHLRGELWSGAGVLLYIEHYIVRIYQKLSTKTLLLTESQILRTVRTGGREEGQ